MAQTAFRSSAWKAANAADPDPCLPLRVYLQAVEKFLDEHEQVFVVEQNRDAQLKSLLTLETGVTKEKLHSILHYSGMPIDSRCIVNGVTLAMDEGAAA